MCVVKEDDGVRDTREMGNSKIEQRKKCIGDRQFMYEGKIYYSHIQDQCNEKIKKSNTTRIILMQYEEDGCPCSKDAKIAK